MTDAYLIWHVNLSNFPRITRYTLGSKIDRLFLDTIDCLLTAGYASRDRKLIIVSQASGKLDTLKFFLKIAWQSKALANTKYTQLSAPVAEIGKMLGGWRKQLSQE